MNTLPLNVPPVTPVADGTAAAPGASLGGDRPGPLLDVFIFGKPAPQGSKSAFRDKHTGRIQQVESSKRVKPWREAVCAAFVDALASLDADVVAVLRHKETPVRVEIVASFLKPVAAPKRRRTWPTTRASGDADKVARSCLDAIGAAGAWRDDSQVTDLRIRKVFVGEDPDAMATPGAHICIYAISETD